MAAVHTSDKSGSRPPLVGAGEYLYECHHNWGQLPDGFRWKNTHGVTIDRAGRVYIKHQGEPDSPLDTVLVFDPDGKFVRSFGQEYTGGGHGIDLRVEDGVESLYLCDTVRRQIIKTDLQGEWIWKQRYPREPGVYQNLNQWKPTNIAFLPDGGFCVADGYGSHYIHRYDQQAHWICTFGGEGTEPGQLKTPHGIWWDDRPGREPALVVADRANARLQYFSVDGQPVEIVEGLLFPASFDLRREVMLVPDLHARVSLFDIRNQPIIHLGDDPEWRQQVLANNFQMRGDPSRWRPGKFIHPHDACFDSEGNIFVVEWVDAGRVTKLARVT